MGDDDGEVVMNELKCSVVIPYRQRLRNVNIALASLAEQTMDRSEFEVVVGALEHCSEYAAAARAHADRLNLVTVMRDGEWNPSRARNLALRHATGRVVVLLDADMAAPADFLEHLYQRYFAHGQRVCVVGQMAGYDEIMEKDLGAVEVPPWAHYRDVLAGLDTDGEPPLDRRWTGRYAPATVRFPWAFARTAVMALPRSLVTEHGLWFDEGFQGWGAEDQEWAFRIHRTGTPILMCRDVFALHVPHPRDARAEERSAQANRRYYIGKWPRLDLEMAYAYGWFETAELYDDLRRQVAGAAGDGRTLGVVRGTADGRTLLVVGAALDATAHTPAPEVAALFDPGARLRALPLVGVGLPDDDGSVDECRLLPAVRRLDPVHRETIRREAERVAATVVEVEPAVA
ncbi:glycosyltransferase family 2 protein [Micromonospora fluostatini]|uniref:glycosyltransferase family 2 protein n=1 Tax=Micromonospora sp. JCM 30529 TaxID=3421643 RepID=UPI003D167734